MICERCGAAYTFVASVDPTKGDRVERRRRCVECNTTFTTVEVYAEVYERLEMRAANFQTIISPEARAKAKALTDRMKTSYVNRPLGEKEG